MAKEERDPVEAFLASMGSDRRVAVESVAEKVARLVEPIFESVGLHFAVLGFTPGKGGEATYCSNADRASMISALREMADALEAHIDEPPTSQAAHYPKAPPTEEVKLGGDGVPWGPFVHGKKR